mmetsp:Transcript_10181/g.8986  ORF Transcript_10181/g.8986 Transcript_10181/m.8986 type:complete len:244 (+) Transcript_10181:484-1215(+)
MENDESKIAQKQEDLNKHIHSYFLHNSFSNRKSSSKYKISLSPTINLRNERIVVYKRGKIVENGQGSGYYLVEFSYDHGKFIIHLSDMETEDEYVKEIIIKKAEKILKGFENDYDKFAESVIIRGNQVVLRYQKEMDFDGSRNIYDLDEKSIGNVRRMKSVLNDSFRKRIKTKGYNVINRRLVAKNTHFRSTSVNPILKQFLKQTTKFKKVKISKEDNTEFISSPVDTDLNPYKSITMEGRES